MAHRGHALEHAILGGLRRPWASVAALLAAASAAVALFAGGAVGASAATAKCRGTSSLTNYVAYTCGHAGPANPKLSPVEIGWVNNQGGTIPPVGLTATAGAQFAVRYVNKYLGGVDGHPLKLDTCFIKNNEQEGNGCAEGFLANKAVKAIAFGLVSVGSTSVSSTIANKLPIIMGYSLNAPDLTTPGVYILFGAGNYTVYGFGTFGKEYLHAKSAAVLYPTGPGLAQEGQAVKTALEAEGIPTKAVGFDPNSTDLTGALEAAGATTADMIAPIVGTGANCLAVEKGLKELGIPDSKVVGFEQCTDPSLKKGYGGDFPHWDFGVAQAGDAVSDPPDAVARAFRAALAKFHQSAKVTDPNYPVSFSEILTMVQWMNEIGFSKLTPKAIAQKAKNFQGPLLLGPQVIDCGKYPKAPGLCADGDAFYKYQGNGKWTQLVRWLEPPPALQKKLGATKIQISPLTK